MLWLGKKVSEWYASTDLVLGDLAGHLLRLVLDDALDGLVVDVLAHHPHPHFAVAAGEPSERSDCELTGTRRGLTECAARWSGVVAAGAPAAPASPH